MAARPYLFLTPDKGIALSRLDPADQGFPEQWLQDVLVKHPDVLPLEEIDPSLGPLVYLDKEVRVRDGRMDILHASGSGRLVIVETKLWRNPESRRQVAAQVLEMAFSLARWNYDRLDALALEKRGRSLAETARSAWEARGLEQDEFEERVADNLRHGRFVVAVVGDRIRASLMDLAGALDRYPGMGLDFALIEMRCYALKQKHGQAIFMAPHVAARSRIVERTIVEVRLPEQLRDHEVKISREPVPARHDGDAPGGGQARRQLSQEEFWELLARRDPESVEAIRNFVDQVRQIPGVSMNPGSNGLVFSLKVQGNRVPLFHITTDSRFNFRLENIRKGLVKARGGDQPLRDLKRGLDALFKGKQCCLSADFDHQELLRILKGFSAQAGKRA